jgi:hypothetical protein
MYSFNITDKTERRAVLEVTEAITSNTIELHGVPLFKGINQIELEEPLTGVEGYVIEAFYLPDGCVVESIDGNKLNLSVAPTKDIKSAKIVLKHVEHKQLFSIMLDITSLSKTVSCRATIQGGDKVATSHLTLRD